jgi:formylglycine-generating enzyme required for sulfatase activity
MGEVWLAHDPNLDIPVAIKTLPRALVQLDESFVDRFVQEARTAVLITHKNLVRVFAADCEGDVYYLVMEYVDGQTLNDLLKTGQVSPEELLEILAAVAEALIAAADHKVIHRDIKPDNIMRARDGSIKLCDMGLAKQVEQTGGGGMTATGHVFGTPAYISPEQAEDSRSVDSRSDIYSLGATAYHLLTGVRAFEGDTAMKVMMQHIQAPLPHPTEHVRELPDPVCAMVCKMMAKKPEERYQSAAELLQDIRNIQSGHGDLLCRDFLQEAYRPRKSGDGGHGKQILVAAACLVAVAVGAFVLFGNSNDPVAGTPVARPAPPVEPDFPPPGKDWVIPELGMPLVWVDELNGWVGKYEVTNGEYRQFRPQHNSGEYAGHSLDGDRQPVCQVDFDDAVAFIAWLKLRESKAGRLSGTRTYRLPTAPEWRQYARCGDGRRYPWGNEWPPGFGNFSSDVGEYTAIKGYDDGWPVSCPVEESGANPWGLYGVGGNVWEWTDRAPPADRYTRKPRMTRGGSWIYKQPLGMTCNAEFFFPLTHNDKLTGFRVVLIEETPIEPASPEAPE